MENTTGSAVVLRGLIPHTHHPVIFGFMTDVWPWLAATVLFLVDLTATAHIVLNKSDSRAALGWVGLIWFVPVFGSLLYFAFGINRVRRKAKRMRRKPLLPLATREPADFNLVKTKEIHDLVGRLTGRPLTAGNLIRPLYTGELVYTDMLAAIASAKRSVGLSTYIFDNDKIGREFVDTLAAAVRRGVAVRVLVDDIGSRYSFRTIVHQLRRADVPTARFLPSLLPWHFSYAQLRNHRKILVVDGQVGFTGGMNIRDGHDTRTGSKHPISDCHFRLEGPVVNDLRAVFADDWEFATGEHLSGAIWFTPLQPAGTVAARGIASGPDDDFGRLHTTFLGALACARKSVRIVTPYFVPDGDLASALQVTALRGISVEIFVPACNNQRLVHWAMMGLIGPLLENGCRIWLTSPPFDHSKLFLVDDEWSLIGSANWDARSLRLNFEFDVECYDTALNSELNGLIDQKVSTARPLTIDDCNRRNLLVKLRDGVVRLASPYL